MRWGVLLLIFVAAAAFGMNDQEFQARALNLKQKQAETEALMQKLGVNPGFSEPTRSGQEAPKRPLFQIHADLTSLQLPVGKLLYGKVFNRLIVGPEGSPVLLVLDEEQGMFSGLRLMGTARQSGTQGRLAVEVNRLIFKTGKTVRIQAAGLDTDGAFGLEAQVMSSQALAVVGAMASSLIAGVAASQQTENVNALGFSTPQTSGRNAVLQGVAQTAADQSKRLIEDATTEKPVLIVESQTPIVVLVQEEVRF